MPRTTTFATVRKPAGADGDKHGQYVKASAAAVFSRPPLSPAHRMHIENWQGGMKDGFYLADNLKRDALGAKGILRRLETIGKCSWQRGPLRCVR